MRKKSEAWNARLSPQEKKNICDLAKVLKVSKSQAMRIAVEKMLENLKQQKKEA